MTKSRKEVSRMLQLWMALHLRMETERGISIRDLRKSTQLWWNRRAWLHLNTDENLHQNWDEKSRSGRLLSYRNLILAPSCWNITRISKSGRSNGLHIISSFHRYRGLAFDINWGNLYTFAKQRFAKIANKSHARFSTVTLSDLIHMYLHFPTTCWTSPWRWWGSWGGCWRQSRARPGSSG